MHNPSMKLNVNAERVNRDVEALSRMIDPNEAGYTRLSFSQEYQKATEYIAELMVSEAQLDVRRDTVGNLIGKRKGRNTQSRSLMIGSHIDTVRQGGRFDGIVGVVAGLEIARALQESNCCLNHPLEVVSFLAEEPSPFGMSTIGSRGMTGQLSLQSLKSAKNRQGKSLYDAVTDLGGDPENLETSVRGPESLAAFIELHIEQGPQLDLLNIPIGIVTGIVAIYRGEFVITGESNHAGTTPMAHRKDALTAAADVVTLVNKTCSSYPEMVGTIGEFSLYPNASNVIPGKVIMGMELRSINEDHISRALNNIEEAMKKIAEDRKIGIKRKFWKSSPKIVFPQTITDCAIKNCDELNIAHMEMVSGAGHDASNIAEIVPSGMIFIPSRNGVSHCPEEFTELNDIVTGIELLGSVLLNLDDQFNQSVSHRKSV